MWSEGFRCVLRLAWVAWVLLLAGGVGVAGAQEDQGTQARTQAAPPAAFTVSVASLQVSPKARQHYERALAAHKSHADQECERELAKALEISPNYAEAYMLRASRAIDAHNYEPALQDALRVQQLNPGLPWLNILFAEYYNGVHRYKDALLILENIHGSEADTWQCRYEWAFAEVGLGNGEAALHWSELVLAAAPANFRQGHLVRAYALELAQRWSEAAVELESYLAAPGSQASRAEVLAALAYSKRMELDQNEPTMASR